MKVQKLLALVASLVVVLTACGGSAEEQILEQLIENSDGEISDLDINTDTGEINISVEGEDGEEVNIVTQDEDGSFNMTIEGEDGDVMTFGGGSVPEGMMTPIADGGEVVQSYSSTNDLSVSVEYPKPRFEDLVSMYDGVMDDDDTSRSESSWSSDDGTVRSVTWYANQNSISVTVADCYSISTGELDSVCVTIYEQKS